MMSRLERCGALLRARFWSVGRWRAWKLTVDGARCLLAA